MNDFLKDIVKDSKNDYASIVDDGVEAGDVQGYIDTGSYAFNALLSGSIYGGLPSNKITAIAGESATGKTFFALGLVKHFLDNNPDAGVVYFETESALTKDMIEERGIDTKRIVMMPVTTIQEFRTEGIRILDKYIEQKEEEPPTMSFEDKLQEVATKGTALDAEMAKMLLQQFAIMKAKLAGAAMKVL